MQLSYYVKQLPLKHTFTIAHQSRDVQQTIIVKLEDGMHYGLGECTTNPFYGISQENVLDALEQAKQIVAGDWANPEELWALSREIFKHNPFAQCALDMAAWDLYAKRKGKKLYELLELDPKQIPTTNFTIGIAPIEKMVAKMKEVNWPIYKIKLGTDHDLEIIRELRKHTDAVFRIDANCAWTADQAINYSMELARLGVEFMEQPLPKMISMA